ncbi:MarR family transcriptional regulator [Streptomyces bingchenggensis BCW-1]|uniref:MarR family transcriptional regulator n=1 Tax=Streptomyces bingchenggensis (strain BCW-1) TaxID=749414 RepID=D7CBZ5_STRBB|nr:MULTISPECIES: hypothetical protein [Streptomyces]ADI04490.1 MarR family transcriptional regulator [Streptomyces bingchenggensis BCW-1]
MTCSDDFSSGTGWNAVLTEFGLARLEQAWPTHLVGVRRHVFDYLDGHALPELAAALRKIAKRPGQCV